MKKTKSRIAAKLLKSLPLFALCFMPLVIAAGCSSWCVKETLLSPVNYSDKYNWVIHTEKQDIIHEVDVFYVYPTVYTNAENPYMVWDSPSVREKTLNIAKVQTGVFSSYANVYAPFCRQLESGRCFEDLAKRPVDYSRMSPGANDAENAFFYYLENYNQGRPFILLGHSQGAWDLLQLLEKVFARPEIQSKLVAAYIIGIAIMPEDLKGYPHLKMAQRKDDTGVIIAYNTESNDCTVDSPFAGKGACCINPLNWSTDPQKIAAKEENPGALLYDYRTNTVNEIPNFCGAKINPERGALSVELDNPEKYEAVKLMGKGVYHMNDIYFFYRALEQNGKERAAAWFKQNQ